MPATPTGPLSVAVNALVGLLSNVPYFQTWTNTGSSAAALNQIFVGECGFGISSISIAGGVLTITTKEPHTLSPAQVITLQGASIGAEAGEQLDGVQTIAATPTSTSITIATALGPTTSPVYPDQAFILPAARPVAIVMPADSGLRSTSVGTGGASIFNGELEVLFENDVPSGYHNDPTNALYQADNELGQLVQGIIQTQGTADLMCLNDCDVSVLPTFTARDEQDDNQPRFERWRSLVRVTWGMTG